MKEFYRVYDKRGDYNHSYDASVEGSRRWAFDAAAAIGGKVKKEKENGEVIAKQK